MQIYFAFIRHGDYQQKANVPSAFQPYPLSEKGTTEALQCADKLLAFARQNDVVIDAVIDCSEMLRSWQTADVIGQALNKSGLSAPHSVQSFPALAERCVGSLANLDVDAITDIINRDPRFENVPKDWKSNSDYCLPVPGAESLMMAGERVAGHIQWRLQTIRSNDDSRDRLLKLVVVHGASLRHGAYRLGILAREQIHKLSMYHCEPMIFSVDDNDTWHLCQGNWKVRDKQQSFID